MLQRGDISISIEELSHITRETIHEPHFVRSGTRIRRASTREVTMYYFMSGGSWRCPNLSKHYEWSKEYYLSSQGLENISIQGDKFYYVALQGHHDISYVYPCKLFRLDERLNNDKIS